MSRIVSSTIFLSSRLHSALRCGLLRPHQAGIIPRCLSHNMNNCHALSEGLKAAGQVTTMRMPVRYMSNSFFTTRNADHLWKSVTTVSNAGKQRGRKGRRAVDLNRGQVIGEGKVNMVWPGLNAPILRGREVIQQTKLQPDEARLQRMLKFREETALRPRRVALHPLERGWSGGILGGRSIGPPDPVHGEHFQGFDTKVLMFKPVTCMRRCGRVRRVSSLVVTGNKNGLIGFARGKAKDPKTSLKQARNRAGQRLRYIERFEEHTVFHDFYTRYGRTQIIVNKKPRGYGLKCHRAIKAICELVGIKDLYAKVIGPSNLLNLTRAFILGLQKQKSLQQWADEMGMHLVEMHPSRSNYPMVVASPRPGSKPTCDIPDKEHLSFRQIAMGGRILEFRKKKQPFWVRMPSYQRHLVKVEKFRHSFQQRVQMLVEYGADESFLTIREKQKVQQEAKQAAE